MEATWEEGQDLIHDRLRFQSMSMRDAYRQIATGELSCRCYLALEKVQCTFNSIPGPPFSLSKDVWRKGHSKSGIIRMLVPMRTA